MTRDDNSATIAGLIPPSEGSVKLEGERRQALGYMALESQPYHNLTPAEHLGCRVKMYVRMPFAFDIAR